MIRYPQVVSALFTALPKRRQGGGELRFGPRGSSRHGFAPLFKTSQLYHFSLHPVSRKAFRSAKKLNGKLCLTYVHLQGKEKTNSRSSQGKFAIQHFFRPATGPGGELDGRLHCQRPGRQ